MLAGEFDYDPEDEAAAELAEETCDVCVLYCELCFMPGCVPPCMTKGER